MLLGIGEEQLYACRDRGEASSLKGEFATGKFVIGVGEAAWGPRSGGSRGKGVKSGILKGLCNEGELGSILELDRATLPDRCFFCSARILVERLSLPVNNESKSSTNEEIFTWTTQTPRIQQHGSPPAFAQISRQRSQFECHRHLPTCLFRGLNSEQLLAFHQ
jgi:hypothetical protein